VDALHLDDARVLAAGQREQTFIGPAAHRHSHLDQSVAHSWLARIGWQRLAELVERKKPDVHCVLEAILRHSTLEPEVREPGAVSGILQDLFGLVEERAQCRDVAHKQGSLGGVELQFPADRKMGSPALVAEQAQPVLTALEGQREGRLGAGLLRRPPQHLDKLNALVVIHAVATDADVTSGFEQPIVSQPNQPPRRPQVRLSLGVIGQAVPRRLRHAVVAEAVPGVAADRVGYPLAAAVEGLE